MRVENPPTCHIFDLARKLYVSLVLGGWRTAKRAFHLPEQSPPEKESCANSHVHETLLCYRLQERGLAGWGQGNRETFQYTLVFLLKIEKIKGMNIF